MQLFELKKQTIKLDYEIGENNLIKSTIYRKFKINLLILKISFNLIGKFLILIDINIQKNNIFLNNFLSNAIYEYSV